MSVAHHHATWLALVPASGPFLSMKVLLDAFPDGLDKTADDPDRRARLRIAHEEWLDDQQGLRPDPAIHRAWIGFVLREALDYDREALLEGQAIANLRATAEHGEVLAPELALVTPKGRSDAGRARLLINIVPNGQDLESASRGARWKASPATRMMTLLHATGVKLGLVTNGEHWMLVHAKPGETTTFVSFYASLFGEEPLILRAFTSLLGSHRFFGVPDEDPKASEEDEKGQTLEALFKRSAKNQADVTDQLGAQVRRALEQLVTSIDRIDRDRKRELLRGFDEQRLYEAAVTVLMRLVFLLAAEERELLPLGQPLYDQCYAVSTLRERLQELADRHGDEVLARRYDAWCRLLATFRAVHGGVRHEDLKLPAYGGSLFDPDRFPFLEGRPAGSKWKETPARPLAIDDLTVLDVLSSIQQLEMRVPGGGVETRRLSFRALGVEQIGHVYEGLLDHTAKRAKDAVVGLKGKKGVEPEIELSEIEKRAKDGTLVTWLEDETGRTAKALEKAVAYEIPRDDHRKWMLACDNKDDLYQRIVPYAGLVREDVHGKPVVFERGAVYVTEGTERRATGTHYTPVSLTEPIVQYTLEPLVYEGPAEGWERDKWRLKSAREILDLKVCDLAMGSGAFLVQACRYLSQRVVEAWDEAERSLSPSRSAGGRRGEGDSGANRSPLRRLIITPNGDLAEGDPSERPIPNDPEERLAIARRLVADRCLYGVDKNPMAVEMAKLSLWLVTLQKDKPFTFVDHALRCGDSLLGLTSIDQLTSFHIDPKRGKKLLFAAGIEKSVQRARELREKIASFTVETIQHAREKEELLARAERQTEDLRIVADLIIGAALAHAGKKESALDDELLELSLSLPNLLAAKDETARATAADALRARARALIDSSRGPQHAARSTFHWPQEFPEVLGRGGFDAFVGNPPFQGGQRITGTLGTDYRDYLVEHLADGGRGSADLVSYFFLRAARLLRSGAMFGMLATNTVAQGDTREVGLDQLIARGCSIPRAVPSRNWPGDAHLEVAHVWLRTGPWRGVCVLDGFSAPSITSYLGRPGAVIGEPYRLLANRGKSFQGSIVLGMGFVLEPSRAQELIQRSSRNREVLFPYLNGQDLNSSPDQSATRWVINFHDWPLDRTEHTSHEADRVVTDYPECYEILDREVRPERQRQRSDGSYELRSPLPQRWWQYAEKRPALYSAIREKARVIALSLVNNHLGFASVPTGQVFAHKLAVFPLDDWASFAILQSHIHYHWAWARSSTMRRDINYSPSDVFETFPFPTRLPQLDTIGLHYHQRRTEVMRARQEGLTKTYNRFHNPEEDSEDSRSLRRLHVELDQAVLAAYGWRDLDLGHGFHGTKPGVRFTISEPARREVLDRLLALNHERYEEEVRQGLHDKKKPKGKKPAATKPKRAAAPPSAAQVGFDFAAAPAKPALSPNAAALLAALTETPQSKPDLLAASGLAATAWPAALEELKAQSLVEQTGERRGAKYHRRCS